MPRQTVTRRHFLASTSGSAVALGLTAKVVRAAPGANERISIGLIGCGERGKNHLDSILKFQSKHNVQMTSLCDVWQVNLKRSAEIVAQAYGGTAPKTFTRFGEMLEMKELDAVVIATPDFAHGPALVAALKAGKDVYVEKPMTLYLKDALKLREVARAHPERVVVVGTQYVTYSSYIDARRVIAEGKIGKPVFSQTSYCRNSKDGEWLYYALDPKWEPGVNLDWKRWCGPLGKQQWDPEVYARWRRYRKFSTGIIGDLLVHRITPLMMALDAGWPTRVVASGGHYIDKKMENHDQVNINIEFEKEHTMIVAGSTANEVGLETMIRGHKANLYLGARKLTLRPERIYAEEVEQQEIEGENLGDSQDLLRTRWIEAMRTRGPSPSPVDLGTQVMVVVDLAARSMWDGRAYAFDPGKLKARAL